MSAPDFSTLGISAPVLKAVQHLGYEVPSPIQMQSIPILLAGQNLLGTAQTGTGKTAAFALPMLSQLDIKQRTPQIIVLTPTRELAIQVAEAFSSYARFISGFHVLPIYGGADIKGQLRGLQRGAQVIVGTPGRVLDHLRRRSLDLSKIRGLVLDEADEMLRMGFIDDVESILAQTPKDCLRALFSATMPAPIRRVAETYLGDAQRVSIESRTKTVERIDQKYLMLKGHQKLDALTRILEAEVFDGILVFVRTKSSTVEISEKLESRGYVSAALNGDLSQTLRERTIARLKKGQIDIVVATDVAARGLDVERISHVINYDVPYDNESYVHRIGRTGRAGRNGIAILFVTPKENRLLRSIEKSTRQTIKPLVLPSNAEVSDLRVQQFSEKLLQAIALPQLGKFKALVESMSLQHGLDVADIAAALLYEKQKERPLFPTQDTLRTQPSPKPERSDKNKREQPKSPRQARLKPQKETAKVPRDLNELRRTPADEDLRVHSRSKQDDIPMVTYRIEVGLADGITPANIVGAIANEADIESRYIGQIKLHDTFSTVALPEGMPKQLFTHLRKVRICQKPLKISPLESDNRTEKSRAESPSTKTKAALKKPERRQPKKKSPTDRDYGGNKPPRKRV
ncbi:MAG TPA: ATP-dependent RNA helicase [Porticoccaceae bacterium]|nr:ATP-dependent RNA helicase [Porticoccaceae bacterium]